MLADYEWGARLLRAGHEGIAPADAGALRVLMFERCDRLARAQVDRWLAEQDREGEPSAAGFAHLRPSLERAEFDAAIARIHELIGDGETYQVNYTYRMPSTPSARRPRCTVGCARASRWRSAPGSRCADGVGECMSCSPELFVRHEAGASPRGR